MAKLKYKFLRVRKYLTKNDKENIKLFKDFYRNIDFDFYNAEHAEYFVQLHDVIVFDKNFFINLKK